MHNTCGINCEKCCPLYNQYLYQAGTPLEANQCEKCEVSRRCNLNKFRSFENIENIFLVLWPCR